MKDHRSSSGDFALSKSLRNLRRKYQNIVDQVVEELKHRRGIEAVLLSGSVARGDFTPYSDIEFNVIVSKEDEVKFEEEDLWRSREIEGVCIEIYYASSESWREEMLSPKDEPRCLGQFSEAKILYDPSGVAEPLVNLARKTYAQFEYPSQYINLARYAVKHNRNKILSRLYQSKELAAAIEADIATSWVLRGLAYLFTIPDTDGSRNIEKILASRRLADEFKRTLVLAIEGNSKERIEASIHLCDLYLQMSP